MSLDSISALTNPSRTTLVNEAAQSNSASSAESIAKTKSDYLNLLTTQLKNQDPTKPTDNEAFTQQITALNSLEQQLNSNTKLDALVKSQTSATLSTQLASSVGYIGKNVEVPSNRFNLLETGEPKFSYDVPKGVVNTKITIINDKRQEIGSFKGSIVEGRQNVTWDGKGADGERLPAGKYTFKVAITDAENKVSAAKTYSFGEVTSVDIVNGQTSVIIDGDYAVPIDKVESLESVGSVAELSSGASYIGRIVEVGVNKIYRGVSGDPELKYGYSVPKGTTKSEILVKNDSGLVVATIKGNDTEGVHRFTWNGRDKNGKLAPAGDYTFSVNLTDAKNKVTPTETFVSGEVTGIKLNGSKTNLVMGGEYIVPIEKVQSIEQKQTA